MESYCNNTTAADTEWSTVLDLDALDPPPATTSEINEGENNENKLGMAWINIIIWRRT